MATSPHEDLDGGMQPVQMPCALVTPGGVAGGALMPGVFY